MQTCLDTHASYPVSSLQKANNPVFQENAFEYGCLQAHHSNASNEAECANVCSGGGCCTTTSCAYNSCSGGGCCQAAENICIIACHAYFNKHPPSPPPPSLPPPSPPPLHPVPPDHDQVYNFPVKSQNMHQAHTPDFYVGPDLSSYGMYDVHPVHGARLSDGSYVMVGKAVEGDDSSIKKSFAVKMSATGSVEWVWSSPNDGVDDASNSVIQLPNGGDLVVAGYKSVGGVLQRSLTKLSLASGQEQWTSTWPSSPTSSSHGAWEMASLSDDGSTVVLAGLHESTDSAEFNFKSYGNVVSGKSLVQAIPVSALAQSSAPTASDVEWTYENDAYLTSKAARFLPDGSVVALLYGEDPSKMTTLVRLSSSGAVQWGPTEHGLQHGEGTDLTVSRDGNSVVVSGHGDGGVAGTLSGRMSKFDLSGAALWSKSFSSIPYDGSAGPHANLIKNECWGVQSMPEGGYVMACGTGIEDCEGLSGEAAAVCAAGTADQRPGAYARPASVWQSMIVRVDADGNVVWQRVDQLKYEGEPKLGEAGWAMRSSASEFVLVDPDGDIVSINDEVGGIGLLRLDANPAYTPPFLPPPPSPPPSPPLPSPPPSPPPPSPPPSPPPPSPPPSTPPSPTPTAVALWTSDGSPVGGKYAGEQFGKATRMNADGTVFVSSAWYHSTESSGTTLRGAVRVYDRDTSGSTWTQRGYDILGDWTNDKFGEWVDISDDGTVIAVGSKTASTGSSGSGQVLAGLVRVYKWDSTASTPAWVQRGQDIYGSQFYLQSEVSMNGDGTVIAIGATRYPSTYEGRVVAYEYDDSSNSWTQRGSDIYGLQIPNDYFGSSTSLSTDGNTLIASGWQSGSDPQGPGYARVYEWSGTAWTQKGSQLNGDNSNDKFGETVAISGDGLVVAAATSFSNNGGAFTGQTKVYHWDASTSDWVQRGSSIEGQNAQDRSGFDVTLSNDGSVVAIGELKYQIVDPNGDGSSTISTGRFRAFRWEDSSSAWSPYGGPPFVTGSQANEFFGHSVGISGDGTTVAVGSPTWDDPGKSNIGKVQVFFVPQPPSPPSLPSPVTSLWAQVGSDIVGTAPSYRFGQTLRTNSDATVVVAGDDRYAGSNGANQGRVQVLALDASTGTWAQRGSDFVGYASGDMFGGDVDINEDGTVVAMGSVAGTSNTGYIRIMQWNDGTSTWTQRGSDIVGLSNEFQGRVAMNADGTVVGVATYIYNNLQGRVRVYAWDGSSWTQRGSSIDGEPSTGGSGGMWGETIAMSADGNTFIAGASFNNVAFSGELKNSGNARVFQWVSSSNSWVQKGSTLEAEGMHDYFGASVSIDSSGSVIAIGAWQNDAGEASTSNYGHVRVFEWTGSAWTQRGADIDGDVANDQNGRCVDLNADGTVVAINDHRYRIVDPNGDGTSTIPVGRVRLLRWDSTASPPAWIPYGGSVGPIGTQNFENFGGMGYHSISLSNDGQRVAVGSPEWQTDALGRVGKISVWELPSS